jgi:hypothetical protein
LKEQIVPAIDSKELMIPLFIRIIGPKAIQQQMSTIAQGTTHPGLLPQHLYFFPWTVTRRHIWRGILTNHDGRGHWREGR